MIEYEKAKLYVQNNNSDISNLYNLKLQRD